MEKKTFRPEDGKVKKIRFEGASFSPGTIFLDGSLDRLVAAVAADEDLFYALELQAKRNLQEELFPVLKKLISEAGFKEPYRPPLIVAGCGPGSYTSVRVSVAAVRAMAQAAGCFILPLDSLDVLMHSFWLLNSCAACRSAVVRDAKMNQVYVAGYEIDDDVKKIISTKVAGFEEAASFLSENKYSLVVSDTPEIKKHFSSFAFYESSPNAIGLISAACSALKKEKPVSWEKILPVYLRVSYAEMNQNAAKS